MTTPHSLPKVALLLGIALFVGAAPAQQAGDDASAAELAKELANPLASLISVPVKMNWDTGYGPADADRTTWLVQPVIPFKLNSDWNLITRTIVPLHIRAQSPVAGGSTETGFGDITQSFFFSPKAPTASGWIWGAGPALLYPTASNDRLGAEKWGAGPTVVGLKQANGWTYGALANHLWSFAGTDSRADLSVTMIQPFLSYSTPTARSYSVSTEATYDWKSEKWTVPLNLGVSQVMRIGGQPVSLGVTARVYLERPSGGPDWGLSAQATFLFPK